MEIVKFKRRDELEVEIKELTKTINLLESICVDLVNKPKGVESHSYSDYKYKKIR